MLCQEGFTCTEHEKAPYYNGHEQPDIEQYHWEEFLPTMKKQQEQLVKYSMENFNQEVWKPMHNGTDHHLLLCAHNEMTAQANNERWENWVLNGEHTLKRKGVGQGIHHSKVISLTVGW